MKNIPKIVVAIALLFATISNAQFNKAEIVATGLTCSMCSNAINKQLKSLADVANVEIDLNTNTFTVYMKKNAKISPRNLKDNVEKAGFFVGSMVLYVPFDNVKISDNFSFKEDNLSFVFIDSKPKTLSGITKVKILDKGFVTQKEFKKMTKLYAKYPSYNSLNFENYNIKTL